MQSLVAHDPPPSTSSASPRPAFLSSSRAKNGSPPLPPAPTSPAFVPGLGHSPGHGTRLQAQVDRCPRGRISSSDPQARYSFVGFIFFRVAGLSRGTSRSYWLLVQLRRFGLMILHISTCNDLNYVSSPRRLCVDLAVRSEVPSTWWKIFAVMIRVVDRTNEFSSGV
jgi:hypothetical protein